MTNFDDQFKDDLSNELKGRASDVGGHPLSFQDVKGKASGIRRRRIALTGVATAAVLAVVVPAGIAGTHNLSDGKEQGPATSTTVPDTNNTDTTPNTDEPPTSIEQEPTKHVVLTSQGLDQGDGIMVPYLQDGTINFWDSAPVNLDPGDYLQFTSFKDETYLGVSLDPTGNGAQSLRTFDSDGNQFGDAIAVEGNVAVSADRMLAAYTGTDGNIYLIRNQDPSPVEFIAASNWDGPITPVAVVGKAGSCVDPGSQVGTDCDVFYNVDGNNPSSHFGDAHGMTFDLPFLKMADITDDRLIDGVVSVGKNLNSCSAVYQLNNAGGSDLQWKTCDYTLGAFSPDGKYVLGAPSYRSGTGDGLIAILDAKTGDVRAEYKQAKGTYTIVRQAAWRDGGTVAALIWDVDHWAVVQLDPEGNQLLLADGFKSNNDIDAPLIFESGS